MNILIKNLRNEKPTQPWQVRVDRASVLGNPFVMNNESERNLVCDKYEEYFKEQCNTNREFFDEIARIYHIYHNYGKLELFCWCAPKRCHAETIRNFLLEKSKPYYVCLTGHRPKDLPDTYGYDINSEGWKDARKQFRFILSTLPRHKVVISGMAQGADINWAIAALQVKKNNPSVELWCYIPCKEQANKWSKTDREIYNKILERADKVVYISEKYTPDCMQKRNKSMVDLSDQVVAFYNGKQSGGTYNTIKYANLVGKPIIFIKPEGGDK